MKKIGLPVFLPLYALFFFLLFAEQTWSDPSNIRDLRKAFSKHFISQNKYLDQLATLRFEIIDRREKTTTGEDAEIAAIDDEMRRNPLTSSQDDRLLSGLRIGEWESPRHDYLYRSDGSWTMLPIAPDATRGLWKIEGNKYYDWVSIYAPEKSPYRIILLDQRYFIFAYGNQVFYEKRLK